MGTLKNPRHETFCQEYLKRGNASEAFRVAYPRSVKWKPETVNSHASNLLKNGKVSARVEELQKEQQERCAITKDRVLSELGKVAFSNFADIYDKLVNQGLGIADLTPEEKAAIRSITTRTVGTTTTEEGDKVPVEVMKIELHDKLKAIERICRMLGFDEPIEITGKDGKDLFASKTDEELLGIVNEFKRKLD